MRALAFLVAWIAGVETGLTIMGYQTVDNVGPLPAVGAVMLNMVALIAIAATTVVLSRKHS